MVIPFKPNPRKADAHESLTIVKKTPLPSPFFIEFEINMALVFTVLVLKIVSKLSRKEMSEDRLAPFCLCLPKLGLENSKSVSGCDDATLEV